MDVIIIADDVTGACDTAVTLRAFGLRIDAALTPEAYVKDRERDADAIAIATNTRAKNRKDTKRICEHIAQALPDDGDTLLYKKVDSMLRGNVGLEIETFLTDPSQIAILAPSLIAQGRSVRDGILHAKMADGSVTDFSAIDKVSSETELPVGMIPLSILRKGKRAASQYIGEEAEKGIRIFLADAVTEKDLERIASIGLPDHRILFCGSAGLLPKIYLASGRPVYGTYRKGLLRRREKTTGIFAAVGSMSPATIRQLTVLSEKTEVLFVPIDTKMGERRATELSQLSVKAFQDDKTPLVLTSKDALSGHSIDIEKNTSSQKISRIFANVTFWAVNMANVNRLLLSGGDIAEAFFARTKVGWVHIVRELIPGVVEVSFENAGGTEVRAATKSGSFGGETAIVDILKKLR